MPTDPRIETIRLLSSIDASLKAVVAALNGRAMTPQVNDSVCNGAHGDPVIKAADPRDWTGDTMKGRHFSECPPDYLDLLAQRYDYFASKEEDAKKKRYNELDSQRARAWAARLRAGWTPAEPTGDPSW
jgi:hypothetical protein